MEKFTPNEAVGVVCRVDGKFQVVEYSEIGTANAELTRPSGQLVYYAGNICNHFFTTAFLRKVSEKFDHLLPHHVAKKKIPCIEQPKPTANNGIKLEKFVFDVFQFSESFVVSIYLKGVFSKPSGNLILGPDFCLYSLSQFKFHKSILVKSSENNFIFLPDYASHVSSKVF